MLYMHSLTNDTFRFNTSRIITSGILHTEQMRTHRIQHHRHRPTLTGHQLAKSKCKDKEGNQGTIKGDANHVSIYGRIWYGIYIPCYGMDTSQRQADVRNSQRRYSGKQAGQLK
ncbi:hypothetical protein H112_05979 [Trichophyton rubrum D6]|uniref:Uncharacterized protein n=3 Tax=Trichophyton TaxID=5550 RepID=F2SLF6_TRIRC|nr:uncharacterized protein TERG_03686 [Trichophyton rubrum CBS 118892]EZF14807.1 hypothetical protein H100_05993 [Trichophyton rubrum MR850]EZF39924.1 hypothetical protein H102_05962 [Trichophyton rubrum CBS 100081]EZF50564.1 hypothetical protein H103_05987 [Trichophyton rubrum CBS 288.86]EZF61108.1 hypothetical protein H104_05975 [Trichophyton rubrum CBS 289.86]EZF71741.1 hypothetical protein H105_06002 [Trichophyton soudanense CBS 452.61]EZF82324.1 hypothetical protein H110_05983 [Trichophy